jgi:hypothetical protein
MEDVVKAVEEGNDINSQTIEGLTAAQLLQPITITTPPSNAKEIVDEAYAEAAKVVDAVGAEYDEAHGTSFRGYAHVHLTTTDLTNPIVQYLLKTEMATGPFDDEVRIKVPGATGLGDKERGLEVCWAVLAVFEDKFEIDIHIDCRDD